MSMRKHGGGRSGAPLFIAQNDPTARGLPKARGQQKSTAMRLCVPRRGLHRRKQGVVFQTMTYGPDSMPKQRRARMSKLAAYGLTKKVAMQRGESQFDAMGLNVKQRQFQQQKMREIVNFMRDFSQLKTRAERIKFMR